MTSKLPTGIDILDRKLDGGIPPGHVVALSAAPASQSELFLYEIATARDTVYLTTERTVTDVEAVLEEAGTASEDVDVRPVDADDPVSGTLEDARSLPDGGNLIVDPLMLLERQDIDRYREFLTTLRARTRETGAVAFLHCLERPNRPRQRTLTEYMVDIVFNLSTENTGEAIVNQLTVPKFRGGQALEDAIKLNLTADVTIDVSRKIV